MGCPLAKPGHHRINDSSKVTSSPSAVEIKIENSGNKLKKFFTDTDNPNPKAIFIFGGTGSYKGMFIWELIKEHNLAVSAGPTAVGNRRHRLAAGGGGGSGNNSARRSTITSNTDSDVLYHYIDVETLVLENIDDRIREMTEELGLDEEDEEFEPKKKKKSSKRKNSTHRKKSNSNQVQNHVIDDQEENDHGSGSESPTLSEMRGVMIEFSNAVTGNWVFKLISEEIKRQEEQRPEDKEIIYVIDLVPNRMNMFKNCLYLKQNLLISGFSCNYIAIHLVKANFRRKDLDQSTAPSTYDEVNANFINYFRQMNKLIEIKLDTYRAKTVLQVTKKKSAFKVKTREDLAKFIKHRHENPMVDLSEFQEDPDFSNNSLMFVVDNQIDVDDDEIFLINDKHVTAEQLRAFVQLYLKLKNNEIIL